jgi:insulysin
LLAQLDADQIKLITKTDIEEFYNKYFSPVSTSRARISVHLHARGAGELDNKIINLLKKSGLEDVPAEKRQSVELLTGHLKEERKMPDSQARTIISQAKELGLKQAVEGAEAGSALHGAPAVESATEITDVRRFKASLLASAGARPVKDLSEYEEVDAKL